MQEGSNAPKVKIEGGSCSQGVKPTWVTCRKKHYGKCLTGISGFFGCGKDDHKVRDCPIISSRGRQAKKVHSSFSDGGVPSKNHFYDLRVK